jgi:hypothetical protein
MYIMRHEAALAALYRTVSITKPTVVMKVGGAELPINKLHVRIESWIDKRNCLMV